MVINHYVINHYISWVNNFPIARMLKIVTLRNLIKSNNNLIIRLETRSFMLNTLL